MEQSQSGEPLQLIVRYRPRLSNDTSEDSPDSATSTVQSTSKLSLKGYGVEMVLKRTDYLAVDDRHESDGHAQVVQDSDSQHVLNDEADQASGIQSLLGDGLGSWKDLVDHPLKANEIARLGLKTASLIMSQTNPLTALKQISQDFPKYSASVARQWGDAPQALIREVSDNKRKAELRNNVWVNGRLVSDKEMDAFNFMSILREERHRSLALTSLGFTPEQAYHLLTDEQISDSLTDPNPMTTLVDASDKLESGGVITYWNNIEKDKRYADWPSSGISALTRPSRPNQPFHQIRKNFWHLILVLDMSKSASMRTFGQVVNTMIQRGVPFRVGFVPLVSGDDGDMSMCVLFELAGVDTKLTTS